MTRLLSFILLLASTCFGQAKATSQAATHSVAQTFILAKIRVNGSKRFAEADIIKASGLQRGATVTAADLKQAADRLGQCGVFGQVSYRYDGESADYTVVDAEQFAPAAFENFVWFSDTDLIQRLHDSLPLFDGKVPLSGDLSDQMSAVLDSILKEKGIQGHVISIMRGSLAGQLQAMQFRIEGVNAKIGEIRFPGSAPDRLPLLQSATKTMIGDEYMQTSAAGAIKQSIPQVYGKLGFLKAQFGVPSLSS